MWERPGCGCAVIENRGNVEKGQKKDMAGDECENERSDWPRLRFSKIEIIGIQSFDSSVLSAFLSI